MWLYRYPGYLLKTHNTDFSEEFRNEMTIGKSKQGNSRFSLKY